MLSRFRRRHAKGCVRLAGPAHWLLALALLVLAAAPPPAHAAEPRITGIRLGLHPGRTRVVLDASAPFRYELFTLDDPYRLVVDMPNVAFDVTEGGLTRAAGLVDGMRFGAFRPGLSRLVLDAREPFAVKETLILPSNGAFGRRVVIDLEPTPAHAFAKVRVPSEAATRVTGRRPIMAAAQPVPTHGAAAPSRQTRARDVPVVVLDPGHGGIDPGAIGSGGTREKDIVLAMAREVRERLAADGRYKVVMTRDDDSFLRLRDRLKIAREAGGDLMISIHADSIANASEFRGVSVYTLSDDASDAEAARLARKENKADIIAGLDLSDHDELITGILIDLAQRHTNNRSIDFAAMLVGELGKVTALVRKTRRFAGFAVLKSPDIPSVLLELGYLSNPYDERLLNQPAHRTKLAGAIRKAIDRYFREHPS